MEKIRELINAIILYLTNHSEVRTPPPWTEIIAAAAVLGSIYSVVYTFKRTRKLQNANARVEWIQKVRNTAAELIATYYSALNEDNKENVQKIIIGVREKVELLALYFGPEADIQEPVVDILDQKKNKGKNQQIVNYLENLSKDFIQYNQNVQRDVRTLAEKRETEAYIQYQSRIINIEHEEVEVDGQVYDSLEYTADPKAEAELEKRTEELKRIDAFNQELEAKLIKLRDIMRIYLKLEWNKAKKGK